MLASIEADPVQLSSLSLFVDFIGNLELPGLRVQIEIGNFRLLRLDDLTVLKTMMKVMAGQKNNRFNNQCLAAFTISCHRYSDPELLSVDPTFTSTGRTSSIEDFETHHTVDTWSLNKSLLLLSDDLVSKITSGRGSQQYATRAKVLFRTWAKAAWTA